MSTSIDGFDAVLSDLCSRPRSVILFLGAGASIQAPTHLPGGMDFSNQALYYLCEDIPAGHRAFYGETPSDPACVPAAALAPVIQLANGRYPGEQPPSCIRMETLLYAAWLRCGDAILETLQCYRCGTPNAYHRFAAQLLLDGGTVVTTNFDTHIEDSLPVGNGVAIVADWPSPGSQRHGALYKIHGSLLSPGTHPAENRMGATLRRVMAPESGKQSALRAMLDGSVVLFLGYSFSDHFDVAPVLRCARPYSATMVFHSSSALRHLAAADQPARFHNLVGAKERHVFEGNAYECVAKLVGDAYGQRTSGHPALVIADAVRAIPKWQRAQALAELAMFIGLYKAAQDLVNAGAPPPSASAEDRIRHEVLRADALSDARSSATIDILTRAARAARAMETRPGATPILRMRVELTLAREMLRHRQFARAQWLYMRLWGDVDRLLRRTPPPDLGDDILELRQAIQTYGALVPYRILGGPISSRLFPFRSPSRATAPDVPLLWRTQWHNASPRATRDEDLRFAVETMNMVAVFMVLSGGRDVGDLLAAVELADAIQSEVGSVSCRLRLAYFRIRDADFEGALAIIDAADRYVSDPFGLLGKQMRVARRILIVSRWVQQRTPLRAAPHFMALVTGAAWKFALLVV